MRLTHSSTISHRFAVFLVFVTCGSLALGADKLQWGDVVVYGDSPSALTAALELTDSGHDVLLTSPVPHIGGMIVEGLGHQDIDSRSGNGGPIGGLAAEFYLRIARAYTPGTSTPRYRFESKVASAVINAWLEEKAVRQLRGRRLSEEPGAVTIEAGKITSFLLEDGTRVAGKIFIDGTVEGDLMAAAGVSYATGREGNAAYGENVGGIINPTTQDQYNSISIDPWLIPGSPASGVIPGVQNESMGVHGTADDSAMAYCLRLPLTKNPANKIPISAPPGYNASHYELYRRFFAAGGTNDWLDGPGNIDPSTTTTLFDLGSWHNLCGNLYGRNHAYPDGSYAVRQQIYAEHKNFTQGLIYWLSNDPAVPAAIRNEWRRWGLPADEFTDNGGWPRRLYVRCARRLISDYVITEADVRRQPIGSIVPRSAVSDPIGIAWWPIDLHNARTIIRNGVVHNEGAYIDYANYRPFGIPYRAIIPRRGECTNLLVPSALSSSYAGYGAVRLEWTFMVLGQSAGTAAALALDGNLAVQDVPYPALRTLLLARKQKPAPATTETGGLEVIVDNTDAAGVALTGQWTVSTTLPGFHGVNYLHDGNTGKGSKTIRFTPTLSRTASYAVYTRWSADSARAVNVPVTVTHAGGNASFTINQQQNGNQWNLLGTWDFNSGNTGSVVIGTAGTSGFVIADAVRFVESSSVPVVTMAASPALTEEPGPRRARFVLHRDGPLVQPLRVRLSFAGTALPGADYNALPDTVVFPAGAATVPLEVIPKNDDVLEGSETVVATVISGPGYRTAPAEGAATIRIQDAPFDRWLFDSFTPADIASPDRTGIGDDPDRDGSSNMMEFLFGTNPAQADATSSAPTVTFLLAGPQPTVEIDFWSRRDPAGFTLRPQTSGDLLKWPDTEILPELIGYHGASDRARVLYRIPISEDQSRCFVRLFATP